MVLCWSNYSKGLCELDPRKHFKQSKLSIYRSGNRQRLVVWEKRVIYVGRAPGIKYVGNGKPKGRENASDDCIIFKE